MVFRTSKLDVIAVLALLCASSVCEAADSEPGIPDTLGGTVKTIRGVHFPGSAFDSTSALNGLLLVLCDVRLNLKTIDGLLNSNIAVHTRA